VSRHQRAKKNRIRKLKKSDGSETTNEVDFMEMASKFFTELYSDDPDVEPSHLLEMIQPRISNQINQDLLKELTDDEIGNALFQIGPLKAPGPDGLLARFFQRN
jgi:hypothetical protein